MWVTAGICSMRVRTWALCLPELRLDLLALGDVARDGCLEHLAGVRVPDRAAGGLEPGVGAVFAPDTVGEHVGVGDARVSPCGSSLISSKSGGGRLVGVAPDELFGRSRAEGSTPAKHRCRRQACTWRSCPSSARPGAGRAPRHAASGCRLFSRAHVVPSIQDQHISPSFDPVRAEEPGPDPAWVI